MGAHFLVLEYALMGHVKQFVQESSDCQVEEESSFTTSTAAVRLTSRDALH